MEIYNSKWKWWKISRNKWFLNVWQPKINSKLDAYWNQGALTSLSPIHHGTSLQTWFWAHNIGCMYHCSKHQLIESGAPQIKFETIKCYGTECLLFTFKFFCSYRDIILYGKWRLLVLFYCHSSTHKYQINIPLDCTARLSGF